MSSITNNHADTGTSQGKTIVPVWVRILHWINAAAIVMMMMSGWQIFNASPLPLLKGLHFPSQITVGGWLGGALQWHFAAMWLLMINGLLYLILGFATGRFRKKLLPVSASGVIEDTKAALTGKLSHDDLSKNNQVQKLLYIGVIIAGVIVVLSGLSIWKPVQFQYLTAIFGGYDIARYVHFICMAAIAGFLIIHVALSLLVPKSLRAMIIGK